MSASNAGLIGSTRETMTPRVPSGQLEALREVGVELAHRQAERRPALAGRPALLVARDLALRAADARPASPPRSSPPIAQHLQRRHRARPARGDQLNELVVRTTGWPSTATITS